MKVKFPPFICVVISEEMKALVVSGVLLFLLLLFVWYSRDGSVLLRDIQALTLYKNQYTTARRSSPIPQLKCVGGTAGCQAFVPEVVQCLNRGWDGVSTQWECKTDMDNTYRFGHIKVSCEGYSHPADAYILKGSCGLEYTLDLTEEGLRRAQGSSDSNSKSGAGVLLVVLLLLAIGIYIMFFNGNKFQCRENEGAAIGAKLDHLAKFAKILQEWNQNNVDANPGKRIAAGFGGTEIR